jgi:hypothetical protein
LEPLYWGEAGVAGLLESDTSWGNADFFRFLAGPQVRFYFKPKHRTFFYQISAIAGKENNDVKSISEIEEFDQFIFRGLIAGGISVFIRQFEFELLAGFKWYSSVYEEDLDFYPYNVLQINLYYIFDHHKNKSQK